MEARPSDSAPSLGRVRDSSLQQLGKLAFLAFIIAWACTFTSRSLLLNLPTAIILITIALWLATHFRIELVQPQPKKRRGVSLDRQEDLKAPPASPFQPGPDTSASSNQQPSKHWRDKVASPVVENAWELLCGSIIQEFVYDMWYATLTPDREFPKEIRRVLNTAFGELAGRARKCDLKGMLLRDVSELVMDQIELYRDTRESITRGLDPEAWSSMPEAARDRALLAELKAENNLHPALHPPDDTAAILGHYKVLKTISEGCVAFLMERGDHAKTMMRSVARELLATCVLRALIGQFTPYNINKIILCFKTPRCRRRLQASFLKICKLLLHSLQKRVQKKPLDVEEVAAAAEANNARPDAAKGNWDFTERARQSIQKEETLGPSKSLKGQKKSHQKAHVSSERPLSSSVTFEDESAAPAHSALKRVKSDTSLAPRHGPTDSDGWEDLLSTPASRAQSTKPAAQAQPQTPVGSRPPSPRLEPASRSAEPASTSGRQPSGHLRGASSASEAGSVVSTPDGAAIWRAKGGFVGKPRARVVAAELNSEGSKDVVIYKIRVADGTGEWTVSRRFRNFEALHRTLKALPSYRLRMPAKRVFTHSQTVEFVEERRQQLDLYLQHILTDSALSSRQEVWEFLSAWSELYGLDCEQNIFSTINASLKDVNVNMRRAVEDIVDDLDAKRRKASTNLGFIKSAASSQTANALDSDGGARVAPRSGRMSSQQSSENLQGAKGKPQPRTSPQQQTLLPGDLQNLASTIFAKARRSVSGNDLVRPVGSQLQEGENAGQTVTTSTPAAPKEEEFHGQVLHYRYVPPEAEKSTPARNSSGSNLMGNPVSLSESKSVDFLKPPLASGNSGGSTSAERAKTAARQAGTPATSERPGHRHRRSTSDPFSSQATVDVPSSAEGSRASSPRAPESQTVPQAAPSMRLQPAAEAAQPLGADTGHIQLTGSHAPTLSPVGATDKMEAVPPAVIPSSLAQVMEDRGELSTAALEEAAGISAPLYDIVDVLFELQSRGFFRRQVYGVARQMLSLVAGGAIDEYILSQLRALRQEHQLARLIHSLQISLWPGGLWFQRLPEKQAPPSAKPQPRFVMTPENYLVQSGPKPLDADEIKEAVRELLMSSVPPALMRVIGRTAYQTGVRDLFDMMQSATFVQQLAYGLLKIMLLNLLPELRPLFRSIERGPLESSGATVAGRR